MTQLTRSSLATIAGFEILPQGMVTMMVLGAALLFCLGLLLGAAWATQACQPSLRRQAEERRRLNEEWSALHAARRRRGKCPRCASPLTERDWYFAPTLVDDPLDDD